MVKVAVVAVFENMLVVAIDVPNFFQMNLHVNVSSLFNMIFLKRRTQNALYSPFPKVSFDT